MLSGSLGSNEAMLRGILLFKISRFIDCNPAYPVEVAICSCQLHEPLCTHKGNDKGIIRQQPLTRPNCGAGLHNGERERKNGQVHVRNLTHVLLVLGELFDYLWCLSELPHGSSGGDEPLRDGFG